MDIEFKGGRVDCPTSPDDPGERVTDFCDPRSNRSSLMEWFAGPNGFGMNENQVRYHTYYPTNEIKIPALMVGSCFVIKLTN